MRYRFEMMKEMGVGRAVALAGTSLALYAATVLTVLGVSQPAETEQALLDFVTPVAQASTLTPDQPSTLEILPTSAQAKSWDKVEYGEHDFDPLPGQIDD
jgi:hypothetical protein